jgi:sugar lactone lactonase YvrE
MNRHFVFSALAAIGLVVAASALVVRAAQQPPAPGTLISVAGIRKQGFSGDGGPATQARLNFPLDVAIDAAGNLFLDDSWNQCIRRIGPDGIITTVAGVGRKEGFSGDGGPATQALLAYPHGLVFDAAGNLYFSDSGNQRVRRVDRSGIITTVAGRGHPADGRGDQGLATDAHFSIPFSVALDPAGNLYVIDFADNRVRRVSADGKIATVAGGGNPSRGVGDGGLATEARLEGPTRAIVDPGGNLFITEQYGERIRKVSPAGIITTVAGTGQVGYTGDGGPATAARLNSPAGLCLDRAGNLYFSEADRIKARFGAKFANGFTSLNAFFATIEGVSTGNYLVRKVIGVAVPR